MPFYHVFLLHLSNAVDKISEADNYISIHLTQSIGLIIIFRLTLGTAIMNRLTLAAWLWIWAS